MHRTIVQNKIISSIYFSKFFWPANVYRPCLGKVRLGRFNPKPIPASSEEKKDHSTQNCMHYNGTKPQFSILMFIYLKKKA